MKATRFASIRRRGNTRHGCESGSLMKLVRKAPQRGWIEVIAGSTFSGSSEEAIRRLHRAQIASQKVQIFKPLVDDRYSRDPDQGKRVIVAGLNQDDLGRPCEPMPRLLAIAEYITRRSPASWCAAIRPTRHRGWWRAAITCWSGRPAFTRHAAASASTLISPRSNDYRRFS